MQNQKPPIISGPNSAPPKAPPPIPPASHAVPPPLKSPDHLAQTVENIADAASNFARKLFSGTHGTAVHTPGAKPPPLSGSANPTAAGMPPGTRVVIFNGTVLSFPQLAVVDDLFRCQFPNGNYWYDRVSGAWGNVGAGPRCVIRAGLDLGGAVIDPNASGGWTRVFINGRQIGLTELMQLGGFARFWPGRHWIDASGNFGCEGQPPRGNLQIAAARDAALMKMAMAIQIGAAMSGGGSSGGTHESAISGWDITGVKVYGS